MKTKLIVFALMLLSFLITSPTSALAADAKASGSSATFADVLAAQRPDVRVMALQSYLEKQDSPMAPYAQVFVQEADKNNIPWNLVPAIAGTESSFGLHEPSSTCYNGWGYGIYGTNVLCFPSYIDAITTISKDIRSKYMDQWGAQTIYDLGRYYAASPAWPDHTLFFMKQIENYKTAFEADALSISL